MGCFAFLDCFAPVRIGLAGVRIERLPDSGPRTCLAFGVGAGPPAGRARSDDAPAPPLDHQDSIFRHYDIGGGHARCPLIKNAPADFGSSGRVRMYSLVLRVSPIGDGRASGIQ